MKQNTERTKYIIGQSSLGLILLTAEQCGINGISLGDREADLINQLNPSWQKLPSDPQLQDYLCQIAAYCEQPTTNLSLPIVMHGSLFQQQVWQAIRAIPSGTTVSYRQLANAIGKPQAVRAVANACAANRLALVIPCHRVVRSDGAISGYRWGAERKAELLKRERQS